MHTIKCTVNYTAISRIVHTVKKINFQFGIFSIDLKLKEIL